MQFFSLLMLGLAMSTDAFAAAVARGAGMSRPRWPDALRIGLIFGVMEAITPVLGWLLGSAASARVQDVDHWVAFVLLGALGLHMVYKSFQLDPAPATVTAGYAETPQRSSLAGVMLTGLATSVDAMAVGVSLAFVDVNILAAAALIGSCTFVMVTLGIMTGRLLGEMAGRRAELAGGLILIIVGALILRDHLNV